MRFISVFLIIFLFINISCERKIPEANYDENRVPAYTLPDPLLTENGQLVSNPAEWRSLRRTEILHQFEQEMYGEYPELPYSISFKEKILDSNYLHNRAVIKEITASVSTDLGSRDFNILYIFPRGKKDVPVFVGMNFMGNQILDTLKSIHISDAWVWNSKDGKTEGNRAVEGSRGTGMSRWPLTTIIDHGYGIATAYYGEIDPDFDDGFKNGFHPLFRDTTLVREKSSTASISMWAKGYSFIADYLIHDSIADPTRLIAIGHSRLGKVALWAGACDERFSAVVANNSGCGGAALSRREYGETIARINKSFPHWYCDEFKKYSFRVNRLPFDQHMLLALMAPRPVYVASATDDQWADPRGEFLALQAAGEVYALYPGYPADELAAMPLPEQPIQAKTGYHLRSGKHDITEFDWVMFINWVDKWLGE